MTASRHSTPLILAVMALFAAVATFGHVSPQAAVSGYPAPQDAAVVSLPTVSNTAAMTHRFYLPVIADTFEPRCKRGLARAAIEGWSEEMRVRFWFCWFHDWGTSFGVPSSRWKLPMIPCNYPRIRTAPGVPYDFSRPLLDEAVRDLSPHYNGILFFLNEPNEPYHQCGFGGGILGDQESAEKAARFYVEVTAALPHAQIVAGNIFAPTRKHLEWLDLWRTEVKRLTGAYPAVRGYAIHPYSTDPLVTIDTVQEMCRRLKSWGGGELWITEWGVPADDLLAYQKTAAVLDYLEREPCVTAHAYYTNAQPWLDSGIAPFWRTDLLEGENFIELTRTGQALAVGP